jgi:glucosamine--fructose-6-phosphate aminotransferase (isomerizing)
MRGYPAGEMKHGPIALIDDSVPVVEDRHRRSLREGGHNIQEVKARGPRSSR